MQVIKKNIVLLFLISLAGFPIFYGCYFQLKEKYVQWQMIEKLEVANLQDIIIHHSEVRWYKKEKEIIFGQQMFDVKSYAIEGDSIRFTGLFDHQESQLKLQIKKLYHEDHQQQNTTSRLLTKLLFHFLYDNGNTNRFAAFEFFKIRIHFDNSFKEALCSADLSLLTPPPKVAVFI